MVRSKKHGIWLMNDAEAISCMLALRIAGIDLMEVGRAYADDTARKYNRLAQDITDAIIALPKEELNMEEIRLVEYCIEEVNDNGEDE